MVKANGGLVFLLVVLSIAGTTSGAPPTPSALFGFGDSYADTGNQNHIFAPFHYPYGITWPGHPTGRFSNGHVQTDYLAYKLGLPSPTPYADIANQSIATGINFALGGSGITYALGVLPLFTQVDEFELVLRGGAYSPSFLADSVTLISNVGNDYSDANYTTAEYLAVAQEVIQGLTLVLERLYELGLRNILVANLPPVDCIPLATIISNHTTCSAALAPLVGVHNELLLQSVEKLNTLPDANFLLLDELNAFTYVLNNTAQYGIKEKLVPCCNPLNASDGCGSVDSLGNPLYTLCKDPASYVYWDTEHPVESTWNHVVDLFYSTPGFVIGSTTLESWLYQNGLRPPTPAPAVSAPGVILSDVAPQGSAYSQLITAYEALLTIPDYAESLGLLQALNLQEYLAGIPDQIVTVFLPNNEAYEALPSTRIDSIFAQNDVLPVVEFHVVKGYYGIIQLAGSVQNLTTISELDLLVQPMLSKLFQILVGPSNATIVTPDLYTVEGQLAIHGINGLLIPPNLGLSV